MNIARLEVVGDMTQLPFVCYPQQVSASSPAPAMC